MQPLQTCDTARDCGGAEQLFLPEVSAVAARILCLAAAATRSPSSHGKEREPQEGSAKKNSKRVRGHRTSIGTSPRTASRDHGGSQEEAARRKQILFVKINGRI